MPLYSYECQGCGCVFDEFRRYEDRDSSHGEHCEGQPKRRIFTPPMIAPDYPGYESPASGKWIEGRRAHLEDLKRTGCRIRESGETEAYMKKVANGTLKKEREAEMAKAVEQAVTETARDMGYNVG